MVTQHEFLERYVEKKGTIALVSVDKITHYLSEGAVDFVEYYYKPPLPVFSTGHTLVVSNGAELHETFRCAAHAARIYLANEREILAQRERAILKEEARILQLTTTA
jgi:hypothetical protein